MRARRDRVEGHQVELFEALGHRKSRGHAALPRRIRCVVLDAEPQVERQATREGPRVLPIHAQVVAEVFPLGRSVPRGDLEGHAVIEPELVAERIVLSYGPIAIIEIAREVVDPGLEVVIAPEQIRLVPADDPLGVMPVVVLVPSIDGEIVSGHIQRPNVNRRHLARGGAKTVAPEVPSPVLDRSDQRIAAHHLPFALRDPDRIVLVFHRFPRDEPARIPRFEIIGPVEEAGEAICGRQLIRAFLKVIPAPLDIQDWRAVGLERVQDLALDVLIPDAAEKPELVPDDPAAKGAGEVLYCVELGQPDALLLQAVVDVVALECPARPVHDGSAVKVVAAGFDHGIDQQAASRHLRVAAHRLYACPVDCVEVHMAALRAEEGGGGRQHPFDHLPRRTHLSVGPEHHCVAQPGRADVQVCAHAGRLVQEGVEPIPRSGENLQLLARELGAGGRVGHIDQRRRRGDRNRFGQGAHAHLRVHSRGEPHG